MSVQAAPRRAARPAVNRRLVISIALRTLLVVAAFAWVILLVVVPNTFLLLYSLWENNFGTVEHHWNIDNYRSLYDSLVFRVLVERTFVLALIASSVAFAVAYPLAYLVVRRFGRYKTIAALLILLPLWVSYLMRVFAWRIILGETGVLNKFLITTGITDRPSGAFIYSRTAVVMTLAYVAIPYVFLASYVALDRIPPHLFEASVACGASGWRTFRHVIWPLTRPGALVGFALGFLLAFGDYVTPALVGGLSGTMLGSIVLQEFGTANDWPQGAAIGIAIMVIGLTFLAVVAFFARVEGQIE